MFNKKGNYKKRTKRFIKPIFLTLYDELSDKLSYKKMEVNKKAWGTIIICKNSNSKNKRYDKQKSLSINNVNEKYSLTQLYNLFYEVIELTKNLGYDDFLKKMKAIKNGK